MKHFILVLVIACASALPVMAGAIPTDGSPEPPPTSTNQATSAPGETPSDGKMSEAALSALLTALGLALI